MSDIVLPNIICFQTQKQHTILNNIWALLKSVLIDLRARETSLRARSSPCAQFVEPCIPPNYTNKIAEPSVIDIINTNRALIEPFSDAADEAILQYSQTEM